MDIFRSFGQNIFHPELNSLGCSQYKFQESAVWRRSRKSVFLKISQNSQENTYIRVSFLNKVADLRLVQNIDLLRQANFLTEIQKK